MGIIYNRHAKALLDVGGGGLVFMLQALGLRRFSTISICDMLKIQFSLQRLNSNIEFPLYRIL